MTMARLLSIFLVYAWAASPTFARSLWSTKPATFGDISNAEYILRTAYPLGNGRLGAMPFGAPGSEKVNLNVDSLWSGGPFEISNYTGGNPQQEVHSSLPGIRSWIFENGTGNVTELYGNPNDYGSFSVLANLTVAIDGVTSYTKYNRSLNLETAVHTTSFTSGEAKFEEQHFCSYPNDVCVVSISSSKSLPAIKMGLENNMYDQSLLNFTCGVQFARIRGVTQAGPPIGMTFDSIARVTGSSNANTSCSSDGTLTINASNQKSVTIVVGAGTNFDQSNGNAENNFSFKGADPADSVERTTTLAGDLAASDLLQVHVDDYQGIESLFSINLPDTHGSAEKETADLISNYTWNGPGDPFLEALFLDYSRYLLISSSRDNGLPANLQGVWAESTDPAWSADYHVDINLQMNYWIADQTGLQSTQAALWQYMELNWIPRGTETAQLLYDADGWVIHDELNIFGHTGMKNDATWADYPAAAAWMMQTVWDYYDYNRDTDWLKGTGYPLLKGIASFWLTQLQEDLFFHDGTLVVNPCNSPEHGPTTFGCTHYQQEIYQVFDAVLASASVVGETDQTFIQNVKSNLTKLDKGLRFTDWGGIKEWKLPDSYGYDTKNTHRHLSHLTGWYPGYAMSSFQGGYTNATIQSAVRQTLIARGNGTGSDGNAGWEKVWRGACWARLNDTEEAYFELRYAIDVNFWGANALSQYLPTDAPFQIDANFGIGAQVLSMLVVDMPLAWDADKGAIRTVVLGPAIPSAWGGGSVKGLKIRGGGTVDFGWDKDGLVDEATGSGLAGNVRLVNKKGEQVGK